MSLRIAAIAAVISSMILPIKLRAAENGINVVGNIVLQKDANGNNAGVVFSNGDVLNAAPKDGKSLLSGAGAPSAIIGNIGDFYLDTASSVLYGPYAGGWGVGVSLIGPPGPQGSTGAQGAQGATGASPFTLNGANAVYTAGSVGIGSNPSAAAALEVSSISKGFLPPRVSTLQRNSIASPQAGLMVYNTTTNQLNFYNGSTWKIVATDQQDLLGQIIGTSSFNNGPYYFTGYQALHTGTISSVDLYVNSTGTFQLLIKDGARNTLRSSTAVSVGPNAGRVTVTFPAVTIIAGEYIGFRYTGITTASSAADGNSYFGASDPPSTGSPGFKMNILATIEY